MDSCYINFVDICDTGFYFEKGPEIGVVCDDFQQSINIRPHGHLIQSNDNKCLFLDDQNLLQASDIPKSSELGCKFFLQMYNYSTSNPAGRAAILYSNKENKKMVVCCKDKNEIYPKEMNLPDKIAESKHDAVFYLRELPASNMYTFESSVYLGTFLGFEAVENNPSMKKLVLNSEASQIRRCIPGLKMVKIEEANMAFTFSQSAAEQMLISM